MPVTKKMASADVAWLRMESPINPMTITGVMMTAKPMTRERVVQLFEERFLPYQRFRMRVDNPEASRPQWVLEEPFDLNRHILPYELPEPGDQDALERAVSDLMSTPLSFAMPPWTIHHVEHYGEGSALIVRLHHCIADGIAMMHVLLSMSDEMWDPSTVTPPSSPKPRKTFTEQLKHTAKEALGETKDLFTSPSHFATRARQVGGGTKSLAALLAMRPDSQTRFKGAATARKQAAWSRPIELETIKAIGRASGTKVNDVLMAAVTGGLRRYLTDNGDTTEHIMIRAAVPFNVRPPERAHELGNAFALVFLPLPISVEDPAEQLSVVKASMDAIKKSSEPAVVFGILQSIGFAPRWVHKLVVNMFSEKCSLVVTNVPGPAEQLHLLGVPISSLMFWVPQSGDIGLGISILSLNGQVLVGVSADANIVSDPNELVAAFETEFDALTAHYAETVEA
ncbi:MAG: wax ester/triacylglycerol synthase family O-acyltransferase [Bacteroidetes bacterium]|nr:wax ester/triacylglycerol synthase family O-acyltransferase [Bacteroidota bacterium]